jgi:hypothetical protein
MEVAILIYNKIRKRLHSVEILKFYLRVFQFLKKYYLNQLN